MIFYYSIAALLWLLAYATILRPDYAQRAHQAALVIFIAVAGLRFETGYDWIAYERYFKSISDADYCYKGPVMEPLFWVLAKLVALVSHDVQLLFFIITTINAVVLWRFCRHFQGNFAIAAATIFGWIYLTLYMGTLRQSLAVCAFLLALMAIDRGKRVVGSALGVTGLGFQLSSLVYLPLLWRAPWQLLLRYVEYFCIACVLYLLLLPSTGAMLVYIFATLDLGFISDKLQTYQTLGMREVTAPMILYLLLNCGFLIYAQRRLVRDATDIMLLLPLMLMVLFQAALADYPIFWMRIMFLALPCQAVFIGRTLHREKSYLRYLYLPTVMILSFAALTYFGRNPNTFMPFTPYQSIVLKYSTSLHTENAPAEVGTGRVRTEKFYDLLNKGLDTEKRQQLNVLNHEVMERNKTEHGSKCIDLTPSYLTRSPHPSVEKETQ